MPHLAECGQGGSDHQHASDNVRSRVVKPELIHIDTRSRLFGIPYFGNRIALENTDEKCRYVVTDDEESRAPYDNPCRLNEARVGLLEQVFINEANGEFGRHWCQFEENLVQP